MLKKLTLALVAATLAMPMVRAAEDLSGKWSGKFIITIEGQTRDDVAYAVLKHTGAEFGGTIGPDAGEQWPISKAKVTDTKDGVTMTFEVVHPSGDGTAQFELALVKGHLQGKAKMSGNGGQSMTADIDLERVK